MSWTELPAEIRAQILGILAQEPDPAYTRPPQATDAAASHEPPTGALASVCKEWQPVFEKKHFARLLLSQNRLDDFERIVGLRRRKLVKHIWLKILLETYDCTKCFWPEEDDTFLKNQKIFQETIEEMFSIMKNWDRSRDRDDGEGLILELSAFSPSDGEHTFKDHNFAHDPYTEPCEDFRALSAPATERPEFDDSRHFWRNGRRDLGSMPEEMALWGSLRRLLNSLHFPWQVQPVNERVIVCAKYLPEVDVVTTFVIRMQYYRPISPDAVAQLFHSLTGLEHVIYEPPRHINGAYQRNCDSRYFYLFSDWVPRTLRTLTIYESRDTDLYASIPASVTGYRGRNYSTILGSPLIYSTGKLENLAVSFIADAKDFFMPFLPVEDEDYEAPSPWPWNNLETLAFTSPLLRPGTAYVKVNNLLHAAGIAAKLMPKLRMMEIWWGEKADTGCIFRYDRPRGTLTWQSTWPLMFESRVLQAWRTVNPAISLEHLSMATDGVRFPASVLRHLQLRDRILHPASYRQVQLLGAPRV